MIDNTNENVDTLVQKGILTKEEGEEIKTGIEEIRKNNFNDLQTRSAGLFSEYQSEFKKRFEESGEEIKRKKN